MEVYYKTKNYELLLGDTLELLKQMPSDSVDMIFTSPPYNLNLSKSTSDFKLQYDTYEDNMNYEEYIQWQIDILNECYRIIKNDGYLFYNHKERFLKGKYYNPLFYITKTKWNICQTIIWNRNSGFNFATKRYGNVYENIYLLYKNEVPNMKTKHSIMTDLWTILPEKNNNHPAPFPLELPLRAIYSIYDNEENKVIMDIFNGSGTTGVASLLLNHKYIGIDISKKYLEMSKKRLDNYKSEAKRGQLEINKHYVKNEYNSCKNIDNQIDIFNYIGGDYE